MRAFLLILSSAVLLLGFQNCSSPVFSPGSGEDGNSSLGSVDTPETGGIFCDPLSGGDSSCAAGAGLLGPLFYMPAGQTASSIETILNDGIRAALRIQMSRFDIADHDFREGFKTGDGSALTDDQGNLLTEYFAMDLSGRLTLGGSSLSGYYQFGSDSDDGSRVFVNDQLIVDADGLRVTGNLIVSAHPVALAAGVPVPFRVQYFQGPKYRIGLRVFMRSCTTAAVSSCNSGWTIVPSEFLSH